MQTAIMRLTERPCSFTFTDEDFERVDFKATEIYDNEVTRHGRTFQRVYDSTLLGEMAELALLRRGAQVNMSNRYGFDHTDPNSYMWDVKYDGHRIEVKCVPTKTKFYNIHERQYDKYVRSMVKEVRPTRIIVGYNMKDHLPSRGNSNVRIGWMLNQDFAQFMEPGRVKRSQYGSGYYVNKNVQMPKVGV
jgi:hypothetical protein